MRNLLAVLLVGGFIAYTSTSFSQSLPSSLTDMVGDEAMLSSVASSLGLSEEQAGGGIGALLSYAQNSLSSTDYESLVGFIPGADKYVGMARDAGVLTDPITDVGRLTKAMDSLGIDADTASSLFDQVGNVVGQTGGAEMQQMLEGLLK